MASYTTKITKKVGIYQSARTSSQKLGDYKKDTKVGVISESSDINGNLWARTDKGWFMLYNKTKKQNTTDGSKGTYISTESKSEKSSGDWKTTNQKYNNMKKMMSAETSSGKLTTNMQLFGIPYQFTKYVDCKVDDVSEIYGRKYAKNFIIDSPVVTIMPGKPSYLPGQKDKVSYTQSFLEAASGNISSLKQLVTDNDEGTVRLYDFQTAYIEYMRYVNVLCRTCAAFLELDLNSEDGNNMYRVNGEYPNLLNFDWKDYRWDGNKYGSTVSKAVCSAADTAVKNTKTVFSELKDKGSSVLDWITNKVTGNESSDEKPETDKKSNLSVDDDTSEMSKEEEALVEKLGKKVHYVQFYCDPSGTNYTESLSNTTQQSQFKGALDNVSQTVKEIAFLTNSGGLPEDQLNKMGSGLMDALGEALGDTAGKISSGAGSIVKRLFTYGSNVVNGDNIIMPDIYSSSSRSASITITIPLKPMYGNKYSYYFDYLVPLMFCIALAFPKATSANTYSSPFLVKATMRGVFNCNLGIVTGISLQHEDSYNVDGLYMGGTVTLDIQDLYPDVAMTPSNDPVIFVNNSSLVEYLATNCGLNLLESQFQTKLNLLINNLKAYPGDAIDSALGAIGEKLDDVLYQWSGL